MDGAILICLPKFLKGHKNVRGFAVQKLHSFYIKNIRILEFVLKKLTNS